MTTLIKSLLAGSFLLFSFSLCIADEILLPDNTGSDDYFFIQESTEKIVSGQLLEDQIWTKETGPYFISELFIPKGVTLTIESGTEVYIDDYLVIQGTLISDGLEGDRVIFTSRSDRSNISVISGGELKLTNTDIERVNTISVVESSLTLHNVRYREWREGIFLYNAIMTADVLDMLDGNSTAIQIVDSQAIVSASLIESNTDNNRYVIENIRSSLSIDSSKINSTFGDVVLSVGGDLSLRDTTIIGGKGAGVSAFPDQSNGYKQARVIFNKVSIVGREGSAIITVDSDLVITDSQITNNDVGVEAYAQQFLSINIDSTHIVNNKVGVIYGITVPTASSSFNATNNWWGDPSGPSNAFSNPFGNGDAIVTFNTSSSTDIVFSPWIKSLNKRNPIIIIPGIMGSRLLDGDDEVWPDILRLAISGPDNFLNALILSNQGVPSAGDSIIPGDIIRQIGVADLKEEFFSHLISRLTADGYEEGVDFFVFPYDWRQSVTDENGVNVTALKEKVQDVLSHTSAEKVDVIAHSMGGLLAKTYISLEEGNVDKFIDIASPHLGAPKASKVLMYGDDMDVTVGPRGLDPSKAKDISQNMPSVYELLPSERYFSTSETDYKYYIVDLADYDHNGVKGKLNFEQSIDFINNTGRNGLLLDRAKVAHELLDEFNPLDYSIDSYNIVGCGAPTLGQIYTAPSDNPNDPHYQVLYINGDGTVPMRSAEHLPTENLFYATGVTHATMPSDYGVSNLIISILNDELDNFSYTSNPNIARSVVNCDLPDGKIVTVHSPVDLHVYDTEGGHTGPTENGDIEYGVAGVVYDIIDGNKFAFIPEGDNYVVSIVSTDSGSFDSYIKTVDKGQVMHVAFFDNVPLRGQGIVGDVLLEELVIVMEGIKILPTSFTEHDSSLDMKEMEQVEQDPIVVTIQDSTAAGGEGFVPITTPVVLGASYVGEEEEYEHTATRYAYPITMPLDIELDRMNDVQGVARGTSEEQEIVIHKWRFSELIKWTINKLILMFKHLLNL